ncbi:MAG: DUF2242 domain-containing protein [Halioglobus sp.]|nr:DUF2242 domain-containing protein [Halioglobus sp.]
MKYTSKILVFLFAALSVTACTKKAVYVDESFSNDSPFKLRVDDDVALACESARRSLLGQGYLIDLANSDEVKARKATRGENTFIEMNVVCVPEVGGSTIFAAGVLSTYDLKKNSSSASVGLSALGSISLPIGQSVDSLVKVSEETIDDKDFYKRFFAAVDKVLDDMEANKVSEEPEVETVVESVEIETAPPAVQSTIWPELFPETAEPETAEPETAVEPTPAQTAAETAPGPVTAEPVAPVSTLPATPVQAAPAEPALPAVPASVEGMSGVVAPTPADAEPLGISAGPGPDEEPLGIPAMTNTAAKPAEVAPQPAAAQQPAAAVLTPIVTTAEEKVLAVPAASAAQPEPTPAPDSSTAPIERIEDLF